MAAPERATFATIRKTRIHEEVAHRLENMILEQLKPGDKLPPERQLADLFAVSRSSIRDAIHTLTLMGLVEARQGAGTVVRDGEADSGPTPLASVLERQRERVLELLEIRKIIEPALAARAATHATAAQIARMEQILRRQEEKVQRGELAIEEDAQFHYNLALAVNNATLLKMVDVLMDLLRQTHERTLQDGGRLHKSLEGHRRILAAVKSRDPQSAESAMRQHVEEIEAIVLRKGAAAD
jgi:GntR family transcriptional repressor for pyruvate dehydrogenase complex